MSESCLAAPRSCLVLWCRFSAHVLNVQESHDTCISHTSCMSMSCHMYERVMSRVEVSYVTCTSE